AQRLQSSVRGGRNRLGGLCAGDLSLARAARSLRSTNVPPLRSRRETTSISWFTAPPPRTTIVVPANLRCFRLAGNNNLWLQPLYLQAVDECHHILVPLFPHICGKKNSRILLPLGKPSCGVFY